MSSLGFAMGEAPLAGIHASRPCPGQVPTAIPGQLDPRGEHQNARETAHSHKWVLPASCSITHPKILITDPGGGPVLSLPPHGVTSSTEAMHLLPPQNKALYLKLSLKNGFSLLLLPVSKPWGELSLLPPGRFWQPQAWKLSSERKSESREHCRKRHQMLQGSPKSSKS